MLIIKCSRSEKTNALLNLINSQPDIDKIYVYGYVYDFSVDYDAIAVDDILDIHKYLVKKNNMI